MSRLRLPNLAFARPPAPAEPPPTATRAVRVLLGRRAFLQALGAASVVVLTPWFRIERVWAGARGRFFTKRERAALAALVDSIVPPDDTPGAADLGVVRYIEGLLTMFDGRHPRLYAGGPYSNRNPFIDYDTGTPATKRPRNAFKKFVAPSRLQTLYWRWQLLGTAGLAAAERALVEPLDAQLGGGPLVGLRERYREGLEQLDALAREREGAPFAALDAEARARVREAARTTLPVDPRRGKNFIGLVVQHTIEGLFAAPEYGGNRKGGGWALAGVEGDSQPLGYALYSRADDTYKERADHPLSTPNPDEIAGPLPLSPISNTIQQVIVAGSNVFPEGC
ncbi:MAG TPA: gluconate 2-dehydrogenase subunit 3 family protein [Candidatus Limnocylindria bacterium]|nr:gluconate 2-dehydrogenase subunit 3 family protein [Candidatus Limnocylindria bacterium]